MRPWLARGGGRVVPPRLRLEDGEPNGIFSTRQLIDRNFPVVDLFLAQSEPYSTFTDSTSSPFSAGWPLLIAEQEWRRTEVMA